MSGAARTQATDAPVRAPGPVARAAARALGARRARDPLARDAAERVALPHRTALEERFGRGLGAIDVFAGPRSAQALGRLGAVSATRGRTIFLAEPDAPVSVVAHEVAHALQSREVRAPGVAGVDRARAEGGVPARAEGGGRRAGAEREARPVHEDSAVAPTRPAREATASAGGSLRIEPAQSGAEREAERAATWTARRDGPVEITEGLRPGTVALLRRSPSGASAAPPVLTLGANPAVPAVGRPEPARADEQGSAAQGSVQRSPGERGPEPSRSGRGSASGRTAAGGAGGGSTSGGSATTGSAERAGAGSGASAAPSRSAAAGPDTAAPSAETAESAAAIEGANAPAADAAQAAAHEAAGAAAAASIAAAATPADRLRAYADAPPSVKAAETQALSSGVADLAAAEARAVTDGVPTVQVQLAGARDLTPGSAAGDTGAAAPTAAAPTEIEAAAAPAPEPEVAVPEVPGVFRPDTDAAAPLALAGNASPEVLAAGIDDSLSAVTTSDRDVPRSAGPRPEIPLAGESDPTRLAQVGEQGAAAAADARDAAVRAVHAGRGPDHVRPPALDAAEDVGAVEVAARAAGPVPAGPEQFVALGLPPDVQASFDEQQGPLMQQSLAGAVTAADEAAAQRDQARQDALDEARAGEERLAREAAAGRDDAVQTARGAIGDARASTVEAQDAELTRVQGEAAERRRLDAEAVDREVGAGRTKIDADFAEADTKIQTEVSSGERRAEAEKQKAERDAQNQSWWDRAVDFVKSAISSLVSAIGHIFDAVRAAVNTVLDAVKKAALAVIAGVASFIKGAITAFGAFLKAAVTGLIGQVFPELAARLNRAIDAAVDAAQKAVDVVADTLSKGVTALVEGLRAGLNKLIDVFQGAVEFAVGLAAAAITGDWSAVLRKVLEAVLRVIGVDPQAFYAFVGRAEETFSIIVNDPLGFVGNLARAVKGGIQAFADHIATHLQQGVIGWLTGALGSAGITMPERFDLMGVLDLVRQILGLTWENLKAKAVALIGERNVERIEQAADWIRTLVVEGWSGVWNRIMADLASLRDAVFDGIRTFIQERVILSAITKLASLLNPVGAIVQLVMAAWNIYTFLRDQLARIAEVVRTVVDAIGDIARGILEGAIAAVEGVFARLLPLAIDLLARLIGLGDVGGKVREILTKVRGAIDKAIDKLIARVVGMFRGGRGAATGPDDAAPRRAEAGADAGGARVAAKDHPAFAASAARMLTEAAQGVRDLPSLVRRARELEPGLTRRLEPGIALRFVFPGGPDDAADGVVGVEVVIAPNTTTRHQDVKLPAGIGSAPGIGDVQAHGAQDSGRRSSPNPLLHTESEHIIPFAMGQVLLDAAGASAGGRRENRRFDQALITIVIYERAARIKTPIDLRRIDTFKAETASMIAATTAARGEEDAAAPVAWDEVLALLDHAHVDAVARTVNAVTKEHGEKTGANPQSNGRVRGEAAPVPTAAAIKDAGQREFVQMNAIFRRLWPVPRQGKSGAARGRPEIASTSLSVLNVMQPDVVSSIRGLGAAKAAEVVAARRNRPFTSKADLQARVPRLSAAFLSAIQEGQVTR